MNVPQQKLYLKIFVFHKKQKLHIHLHTFTANEPDDLRKRKTAMETTSGKKLPNRQLLMSVLRLQCP